MAEKQFVLDLAKLVIAVAWADGTLVNEELNAVKDLLFVIPDLTGEDWQQLEIFMDSPVTPEEREGLLKRVVSAIRWTEEKQLVIDTVTRLVEADGALTPAEATALAQVKHDVEGASTGLLAHLTQTIHGAMGKRRSRVGAELSREERLDDFIKNRVYYHLVTELEKRGQQVTLPDAQIRKLCLAAGLMAHVAWADREVAPEEKRTMTQALKERWTLSDLETHLVTEIGCSQAVKGLDVVRLARNFFDQTTRQERNDFVRVLFQVANAAQTTSSEEIKMIQFIAKSLKLAHQEFIEAKLTIPRADRGGM
jgi:uncharacterized tellurite resistance protein B-like protein